MMTEYTTLTGWTIRAFRKPGVKYELQLVNADGVVSVAMHFTWHEAPRFHMALFAMQQMSGAVQTSAQPIRQLKAA